MKSKQIKHPELFCLFCKRTTIPIYYNTVAISVQGCKSCNYFPTAHQNLDLQWNLLSEYISYPEENIMFRIDYNFTHINLAIINLSVNFNNFMSYYKGKDEFTSFNPNNESNIQLYNFYDLKHTSKEQLLPKLQILFTFQ